MKSEKKKVKTKTLVQILLITQHLVTFCGFKIVTSGIFVNEGMNLS